MKARSAAFMGGRQAGCIGLLTLYAACWRPSGVVAYDDSVKHLAETLGLELFPSIRNAQFQECLSRSDLLVSVHGREIVPNKLLSIPPLGAINVHPCLYQYKGANPVARLLQDGNPKASVGVHRMTDTVDEGEVLAEEFVQVDGKNSAEEVYNALYPHYATTILKALIIMGQDLESQPR